MKIFISWSGPRSHAVALALWKWLPCVITSVRPWLSDDIDAGDRWSKEIAVQLKESQVGIICLTPENLGAPWILFEAGALSKSLEVSRVCTYLFGVLPADVGQPLGQFQATRATRDDTRRLVATINRALGEAKVDEGRLDTIFEKWWPDLEGDLRRVTAPAEVEGALAKPERTERELLEEILAHIRSQQRRASGQPDLFDPAVLAYIDAIQQAMASGGALPSPTADGEPRTHARMLT
jgi:TIR domain